VQKRQKTELFISNIVLQNVEQLNTLHKT